MTQSDSRTADDDRVLSITVGCVMAIINSYTIPFSSIPGLCLWLLIYNMWVLADGIGLGDYFQIRQQQVTSKI